MPTKPTLTKTRSSTSYGRSPWVDAVPRSRVPAYPRHRAPFKTDVVVVGGGLTGCTTAYVLAAAGVKVALIEAEAIGRGSSGSAMGWIAGDPCLGFVEIEAALGRRTARHVWRSWHRAALDFGALLRRLDVPCGLEPCTSLQLAVTPEHMIRLRGDRKARLGADVEAPLVNAQALSREVAIAAGGALRTRAGFTMDPYRAAIGLASEAVKRGAMCFESSPVRRITFNRRAVDVHTAGAAIRANRVVIATGVPTMLFKALRRHFWFESGFMALTAPVPSKIRNAMGLRETIVRDMATPVHTVRWLDKERLLIAGANLAAPPDRLRQKTIVQRTGQLMYELSTMYPEISGILPTHGWDSPYARTADGLPYIGSHRNYPHHLFAVGDSSPSVTSAYLAARLLLRQVQDDVDPADEAFGFNRYGHVR